MEDNPIHNKNLFQAMKDLEVQTAKPGSFMTQKMEATPVFKASRSAQQILNTFKEAQKVDDWFKEAFDEYFNKLREYEKLTAKWAYIGGNTNFIASDIHRSVAEYLSSVDKYFETVEYDPKTHPREYAEQIKKKRRLLREALIQLGTKLSRRHKKISRIIKHVVKLTYSKVNHIDLRRDMRKVVRDIRPYQDDEEISFLINNSSANRGTNEFLERIKINSLLDGNKNYKFN